MLLLISTLPVMTGAVLSPALRSAFGGDTSAQTWARWALTTPALFTAVGAPLAGLLADRTGRRPVLLASLVDGVGEAAPPGIRGRVMGGLSTLRNLGRFASPVLAGSALAGSDASALFIGGAALAGGLALATLLWAGTCVHPRVSASDSPAATADEPVPC